jgi:sirohydrochlorin ferrochelatase
VQDVQRVGNPNARKHGRYRAQSREIRTLGVHWAAVATSGRPVGGHKLLAHADAHRVAAAEERVAACAQRVRRAALALDRVLVERGDEDARQQLVEGALRLTESVAGAGPGC